jgi:hypothetical protein
VTEKKVCLWLQDDLLLRRVLPSNGKGHRRHATNNTPGIGKRKREEVVEEEEGEGEEEEVDELAIELAQQLKAASSAALLLDTVDSDSEECSIGTLFSSATIDVYIAGVAELHHEQHSLGLAPNPTFRGPALQGLLQSRYREEGSIKRRAYIDRGASGITAGYTEQEFLYLQEVLLRGSSKSLIVSPYPSPLLILIFILIYSILGFTNTSRYTRRVLSCTL